MDTVLAQSVRQRAGNRCEYCLTSATLYRTVFHVDHVIAVKHGGATIADNLALACLHCNLHKGTDIASLDPTTGALVRLFNPRIDRWSDHFACSGPLIVGRTDVGRTTARLLQLNDSMLVAVRESLSAEGLWPPA
jgi:hypothetical protein